MRYVGNLQASLGLPGDWEKAVEARVMPLITQMKWINKQVGDDNSVGDIIMPPPENVAFDPDPMVQPAVFYAASARAALSANEPDAGVWTGLMAEDGQAEPESAPVDIWGRPH